MLTVYKVYYLISIQACIKVNLINSMKAIYSFIKYSKCLYSIRVSYNFLN